MARYRKKPVVIHAVQWDGRNIGEVSDLLDSGERRAGIENGKVIIHTLEGTMTGNVGDWIIRGVKGECYPCKPDIFEATYEPVNFADAYRADMPEMEHIWKENEALRKDAERYRWLRRGNGDYYIARDRDGKAIHDPDTFIDAAIAEEEENK